MASLAKDRILSANVNDINKAFIEDMFASYHDKESNQYMQANFVPTEVIKLTKQEYQWVDKEVVTTTGMLVFNRYILERTNIIEHLGYWNTPIDKNGLNGLTAEVNNLTILNKITMEQLGQFIDSRDRLGFWCASFLSVALTPSLLRPMADVEKRKAELFKQYENEIR